jgi:glycosyltransferase involved in cell wall biosynthesis
MNTPPPLRIAMLLESDGPGGAERILVHLAEAMTRRGHHVIPVGPADGCGWLAGELRKAGIGSEAFRLRRAVDPRCAIELARLFMDRRVDVAHSHEFSMALYGAAAARLARVPHIITMHGSRYFDGKSRRRIGLRWAFRASQHAIAVSEATRADLEGRLKVAGPLIGVIHNGVPEPMGDREKGRRELGLERSDLLILAVGNLYGVKGHDVLLHALHRLPPALGWRLAVAGRGPEEVRLRELAARLSLSDRVHLLGYRSDTSDLMAAADIIAMPSRSEGLPLTILEAMFARRPIVASAVGGIPDALGSGGGLLVPPGDPDALAEALTRLLLDPDLRSALSNSAAAIAAARFSVEAMADAYERCYLEAAGTGVRRTRGRPVPASPSGAGTQRRP